jgi:hypothetical protein
MAVRWFRSGLKREYSSNQAHQTPNQIVAEEMAPVAILGMFDAFWPDHFMM